MLHDILESNSMEHENAHAGVRRSEECCVTRHFQRTKPCYTTFAAETLYIRVTSSEEGIIFSFHCLQLLGFVVLPVLPPRRRDEFLTFSILIAIVNVNFVRSFLFLIQLRVDFTKLISICFN